MVNLHFHSLVHVALLSPLTRELCMHIGVVVIKYWVDDMPLVLALSQEAVT